MYHYALTLVPIRRRWPGLAGGLALSGLLLTPVLGAGQAGTADQPSAAAPRQLSTGIQARTGDFDMMLDQRVIRILVPYSRSLYYNDRGRERGLAAELARDFETWLNRKYAKQLGKRPITVVLFPVTRDRLIADLPKGLGDIGVGNLVATPARLKLVDFYTPEDLPPVREIVVTGPGAPAIATVGDLSGHTVHVRRSSSYYESLLALNEQFARQRKPAVALTLVPDALEDEDLMDMAGVGLVKVIVVDDWKARAWKQVVPAITLHEDVVVREEGRSGWAYRKQSPKLATELKDFYQQWVRKQGVIAYRQAQYLKKVKQIVNSTDSAEWQRFERTMDLFEKYGGQYRFDPLMLAAQGFQESRLKQDARSHVGAIGVMQLMPATGAEMQVGDVRQLEANIHAGAKYMDQLMTRYFKDANFDANNRTLFAFASYNAGPGNIAKARKAAVKQGLDPNQWFNNVELVVARQIGIETTTYVRNIYKYYVAYKLQLAAQAAARRARSGLEKGSAGPATKPGTPRAP